MSDISAHLQQQVKNAADLNRPLYIQGGGSKAFYGHPVKGDTLSVADHSGIISYDPTELVITARGGTLLSDIEAALNEHNQFLTFEPPHFTHKATIGGAIASGLAGPRRPWGGAPRDMLLGCKILDGSGQILNFGGQVMKNVAGYDISRLMAGALGTLGILLEVSIKVLPKPAFHETLVLEMQRDEAVKQMRELATLSAPLSAACHLGDKTHFRLSGNAASVETWAKRIGGELQEDGDHFWQQLRDHQFKFFISDKPLWRVTVPPATDLLGCEHRALTDWAGAQRWVYCDESPDIIRRQVEKVGGHATLFRSEDTNIPTFHPLDAVQQRIHRGLKQRFDPKGLLNPARMYAWL